MKKTLAILLALILVLVNVAVLAEEPAEPKYKASSEFFFNALPKNYDVVGATTDGLYPQETLTFTVTADKGNPDGGEAVITVGPNKDNHRGKARRHSREGLTEHARGKWSTIWKSTMFSFRIVATRGRIWRVRFN